MEYFTSVLMLLYTYEFRDDAMFLLDEDDEMTISYVGNETALNSWLYLVLHKRTNLVDVRERVGTSFFLCFLFGAVLWVCHALLETKGAIQGATQAHQAIQASCGSWGSAREPRVCI